MHTIPKGSVLLPLLQKHICSGPCTYPCLAAEPLQGFACHWSVQNTDPSLMAPSKVQSPQGLACLEWDTQPVAAPGKGLQDVGKGC